MNYDAWIEGLKEREGVERFVKRVVNFSRNENYSGIFRNCGLYVVGSSARKNDTGYNDIDVTLVGLDFRRVFHYDMCHLEDPEALIKAGVFVLGESPNVNVLDEIKHKGRTYHYCGQPYDSFCAYDHIGPSGFTVALFEFLDEGWKSRETEQFDGFGGRKTPLHDTDANPFLRYQTAYGDFLGAKSRFGLIDFIVHGENLLVPFWKKHQEENELPYVVLHEWNDANREDWGVRRIPRDIPIPEYIDPVGRKRSEILRSDFQW